MVGSRRWVSNIKISILLKKGWFSYARVSLKREEYYIHMAQLSLQSFKVWSTNSPSWKDNSDVKETKNFTAEKRVSHSLRMTIEEPLQDSQTPI